MRNVQRQRTRSKAAAPGWLVRLVAQIGPPRAWHDTDSPEVLVSMLKDAEAFYRRAGLIERLDELAARFDTEAGLQGIAAQLRRLARTAEGGADAGNGA